MAHLVGPLVSVHNTLTLLSDRDCLANPLVRPVEPRLRQIAVLYGDF